MGRFLGSVHFRTEDVVAVRAAVEAVAKARRAKFFVAPPRGGWVTVYPFNAGQDQALAQALAKRAGGDVVHVGLHDDDVFFYTAWRGGKKLDSYNSQPDYFEFVGAAVTKRLRGRPEGIAHLLPPGVTPDEVGAGLAGDAYEQHAGFARRLGLPGWEASYEDLLQGDVDEHAGVDRETLVHVPDLGPELRRKAEAAARAAAERRRLVADRLLLLEDSRSAEKGFQPQPIVCAGVGPADFLCAWCENDFTRADAAPLLRLAAPFAPGGTPAGISVAAYPRLLSTSPSGRFLAVGSASGNWAAEAWDLHELRRVAQVALERACDVVAFTPGEAELLALSTGVLTIAPLSGGAARKIPLRPHTQHLAVHPQKRLVVTNDGRDGLSVTDLDSGEAIKRLAAPEDLVWVNEGALEQVLAAARTSGAKAADLRVHEQYMREAMKAGMLPGGPTNQVTALAFTADGTRLLVCTWGGLRVYEWEAVLKAPGDALPPARFEAGAIAFIHEFRGQSIPSTGPVYDVVHDAANDRAVFCENAGVVRSLDLKDGTVRPVVRPPEPGRLWKMALSRDGSLLAFGYRPGYEDAGDPTPYRVHVWDYARLAGTDATGE